MQKPAPKQPTPKKPAPAPLTKEDALRQMAQQNPEQVAALLKEILKGK